MALLLRLCSAVSDQQAGRAHSLDPTLGSVQARRLLELLRHELIAGWAAEPREAPNTTTVVSFLGALETAQEAMDRSGDRTDLAGALSAPDGLELVVEVAHDLRSPLTSILFLAETIQRGQSGPVSDLQHRQLGLIYSAALGLSTMASNVMELARGGARLADEDAAPFSIAETFESVHDIVSPMAEEKGLTIRLLPPANDRRLGVPHALNRVLLNLTTNAIKFTEEGFVELVGEAKSLTRVEFTVRDTGHGIAPQALETLYHPFRKAPQGDRYAFSSTGLGLALCRRLVAAMGAELQVETRPDWGTKFFFELDLPPASKL